MVGAEIFFKCENFQRVGAFKFRRGVQCHFRTKLVVEPSGDLGLAALLSGAVPASGRMGVIVSGGNVDGAIMRRILAPPT